MKGEMFNILAAFIERKKGAKAFSNLVQYTNIESEGPFQSEESYPDSDYYILLEGAGNIYHLRTEEMQKMIGTHLFRHLLAQYPDLLNGKKAKKILLSLDKLMRIEINKLCPEIEMPEFIYKSISDNELEIIALSENKASFLIESVINEVSSHCNEKIAVVCRQTEFNGKDAYKCQLAFDEAI